MTLRAKKAALTFADSRKKLLCDLKAGTGSRVVEKKINFHNDDVPSFLKRLKKFDERSRAAVIMVK